MLHLQSRTASEMEETTKEKRTQITCRSPAKALLEEINLPHVRIQFSTSGRSTLVISARQPRLVRRLSFKANAAELAVYCIFTIRMFYNFSWLEVVHTELPTIFTFILLISSVMQIVLAEILQAILYGLSRRQRRRALQVKWFHKAFVLIMSTSIILWVSCLPAVSPVSIPPT